MSSLFNRSSPVAWIVAALLAMPWLLEESPTRGRMGDRSPLLIIDGAHADLDAFEGRLDAGLDAELGRLSLAGRRIALWRVAPPPDGIPEEETLRLRTLEGFARVAEARGWRVGRWSTRGAEETPLPENLATGSDLLLVRLAVDAGEGDASRMGRRMERLVADWRRAGRGERNVLCLCRGYGGRSRRLVAVGLACGPAFQPHDRRPSMPWDGLGGMLAYWAGATAEARRSELVPTEALSKGYVFHHEL